MFQIYNSLCLFDYLLLYYCSPEIFFSFLLQAKLYCSSHISIAPHSLSFFIFSFCFCSLLLILCTDSDIFEVSSNFKRWFFTTSSSLQKHTSLCSITLLFLISSEPRSTMSVHLPGYPFFHFIQYIFVKII